MWGYPGSRCRACGATVAPDFVYCHWCGSPLLYTPVPPSHMVYAPAQPRTPAETAQVIWGVRTKRGLILSAVSFFLLWVPGLTVIGAALLSIGSTLMFWDRQPFSRPHRSAMTAAYSLLWVAASIYVILFLVFVGAAYSAWLRGATLDFLRPAVVLFVWDSTLPTELVVVALALQVRFLLRPKERWQWWGASAALVSLVLVATVIAHLGVAAGIGDEFVRMSSVLGVLNRISVARLAEGPGFAWLAYLYFLASRNILPKTAPAGAPAPVIAVPPAN